MLTIGFIRNQKRFRNQRILLVGCYISIILLDVLQEHVLGSEECCFGASASDYDFFTALN